MLYIKPIKWMSSPWEKMQRGKKRGTSLSPGYSHMKGEGRLEREGVSKENEGGGGRRAREGENLYKVVGLLKNIFGQTCK